MQTKGARILLLLLHSKTKVQTNAESSNADRQERLSASQQGTETDISTYYLQL